MSRGSAPVTRRRRGPVRRLLHNLRRLMSINRLKEERRRIGDLEIVLDTLVSDPVYVFNDTSALNGQSGRMKLVRSIVKNLSFDCVIETGTFVGNSAGWFHHVTSLPVRTSEINPRFHGLARKRLAAFPQVYCELGDSVDALIRLAASADKGRFPFFYLDAHWYRDLPLARELQLISDSWERFVIMIDDFEVPGDEGYGFDDYGFGRRLSVGAFQPHFKRHSLAAFSPSLPSEQETGGRSGSIVLARAASGEAAYLAKLPELRSLPV